MAAVCALDLGGAKTCLLREDRCDLLVCVCVCVSLRTSKTCLLGVISLCVSLAKSQLLWEDLCDLLVCISLLLGHPNQLRVCSGR